MRNIKEAERITGITRQNIRYYEKAGLIQPARNQENDYREYSEADIHTLMTIKLFRKLDMPIEEIQKILQQDMDIQEAMRTHKERLIREKERLSDALEFCSKINETKLSALDVNGYLKRMEEEERKGAVFMKFVNDFKEVAKAEGALEFSFVPDAMCYTPQEFTEELFRYANKNDLNLVITKEGMCPEFTLDGTEYVADRVFGRFGAIIYCHVKDEEAFTPKDIPKKRYRLLRFLWRAWPPILVGILFLLAPGRGLTWVDVLWIVGAGCVFMATVGIYHNMKD